MATDQNDFALEYISTEPLTAAQRVAERGKLDTEKSKSIAVTRDAVKLIASNAVATRPTRKQPDIEVETDWTDTFPAILAAHAKDIVIDAPIAGTTSFLSETLIAATDLTRFVLPLDTLYYGFKQQIVERDFSMASFERGMGQAERNAQAGRDLIRGIGESVTPSIDNPVAQMEASMIQFIEGFIPVSRGITAINAGVQLTKGARVIQSAQAAAITSAIVFDPDDPNLANIIELSAGEGGFPDISNAITAFLATKPGDPASYNRLRNALTEAVAGPIADGFLSALRFGKAQIWKKHIDAQSADNATIQDGIEVKADADNVAETLRIREEIDKTLREQGDEGAVLADELAAKETLADTGPQRSEPLPDVAPLAMADRPKLTQDSIREDFQNMITPDLRERLIEIVTKGEYLKDDMGWFNGNKFDLADIESREDLLNVFGTIENIIQDVAESTGRIKSQTWEQTQRLAAAVGLNAEQAHQLFADLSGNQGLAARMHASHQTMIANGKRMLTLMEIARKTQNPQDIVEANRAIELQAAIMMEVKGSQSEVARAMNAMKIQRAAGQESFEELASAAREFGVRSDYIEKVLAGKTDLASVNAAADLATRATIPEMIAEIAVNGLLMNPTTHMVNMSSNTSMLVITPWERFVAAGIGRGRTALGLGEKDRYLIRAVGRSLSAQVKGMMETFRFTYQALKDGAPVTDIKQRFEIASRPRISARSLGIDGKSAMGITIDKVIAPSIRISTRLLSAEDEFFKSILVRGERAALAYEAALKAADDKGLTGNARSTFIAKREKFLVENPTVAMQREAIDVARRGTFQESAQTGFGPVMERLINFHPFIKLTIAPFFRTPMNVIRQTFVDRVPGLNLFMKQNRDALAAGGREGDMVIARVTTGTAAITTGYFLVSNFQGSDGEIEIIGKRPYDSTGRFDKVKDYSIRLGDTWYRYNRFDPVGSWLAFAADSTAIMDARYDPADPDADAAIIDYMAAATGATMRNVMDKVWLKSISRIVETLGRIDRQSPASARRAMESLFADQVIKVIPFSSGLRAWTKQVDPIMREAWTVADRVMAIMPGGSDGLAPRRDELGRVIPNDQGANFLINPFAAGPEDDDPLNQELARLDFSWPRLDKSLEGGNVPLNAVQYSRYKEIIGQVPPLPGMPALEDALRQLTESHYYSRMTDTIKIETIQSYRNAYRQIAQQTLMQEYPELQDRSDRIFITESEEVFGKRLDWLRALIDAGKK